MGTRAGNARIRDEKRNLLFNLLDKYGYVYKIPILAARYHTSASLIRQWVREHKEKKSKGK